MRHPALKLFEWNLIAVLGTIRAERCSADDNRASISRIRSAVQIILGKRGNIQLCLKALSRELYLSASHMAVLFTRVVGASFRQYVRSVRLASAAEMLTESNARIADVSATLGYTEPSNFVRDVRSGLDVCPIQLRSLYSRPGFVWGCPLDSGMAGKRSREAR
jgi:two-component system response regulator YesN